MKKATICLIGPVPVFPHVRLTSLIRQQVFARLKEETTGNVTNEELTRATDKEAGERWGFLVEKVTNTMKVLPRDILNHDEAADLVEASQYTVNILRPKDQDVHGVTDDESIFNKLRRKA